MEGTAYRELFKDFAWVTPTEMEPWKDDKTGEPKHLGDLWTLTKNRRKAVCVLVGHPLGSEARVIVDDDVIRTEHFRTGKEMLDTTTEWRRAFEAKGWKSLAGS